MTQPFVLIAKMRFNSRGGTQIATRDFALGLVERGWRVAISARVAGPETEMLQGKVPCVTDLDDIEGVPDIIHGHRPPGLLPCLMYFPATPAIRVCHNAVNWDEHALILERIRRQLAVDEACREHVAADGHIPIDSVGLLPNAVDLRRFKPRDILPGRPRRALVVAHRGSSHVDAAVAACRRAGIEVETLGLALGRVSSTFEHELARADVVFGAARIALEAFAAGCAVVVCDTRGLAGMAKSVDFEEWYRWNFGMRLLTKPVTVDSLGEALAAYDADDAAALCRKVREACSVEKYLDRLEAIYRDVIHEHRESPPVDRERELRAVSKYLTEWLPVDLDKSPFGPILIEWAQRAHQSRTIEKLVGELDRRGIKVNFQTPGTKT